MRQQQEQLVFVMIDMQTDFETSKNPYTQMNVERELRRAVDEDAYVIVVEYVGYGETHGRLMKVLVGYPRLLRVSKRWNDGAQAIAEACKSLNLSNIRFRVMGVNTHACVYMTVEGLIRHFPSSTIEVVKDACNSTHGNHWDQFPKATQIALV